MDRKTIPGQRKDQKFVKAKIDGQYVDIDMTKLNWTTHRNTKTGTNCLETAPYGKGIVLMRNNGDDGNVIGFTKRELDALFDGRTQIERQFNGA